MSEGIKVSWAYTDPPASPDGNYWFLTCMQSTISSICEEVIFNSTFRHDGIFSVSWAPKFIEIPNPLWLWVWLSLKYIFPFHGVNLLGGHGIVLNFTVRSVCRPRDCKIDWPCQEFGDTSNVLQLDLDRKYLSLESHPFFSSLIFPSRPSRNVLSTHWIRWVQRQSYRRNHWRRICNFSHALLRWGALNLLLVSQSVNTSCRLNCH